MIRQTILPFEVDLTRDIITPHAGLALVREFAVGLGLWRLYQTAGKIVFHGGQAFLKVKRGLCQFFTDIQLRIWECATT